LQHEFALASHNGLQTRPTAVYVAQADLLAAVQGVFQVVRLKASGQIDANLEGCSIWQAMLLWPRGRLLESSDEPALLARVAVDVAGAIDGCATLKVAHRDVTPHNFITYKGRGYLTDFSAAKVRQALTSAVCAPALIPCQTHPVQELSHPNRVNLTLPTNLTPQHCLLQSLHWSPSKPQADLSSKLSLSLCCRSSTR
jgi:hypothetical protein